MYFDNLVALTEFLSAGGNSLLGDRVIRIDGVLNADGEEHSLCERSCIKGKCSCSFCDHQ